MGLASLHAALAHLRRGRADAATDDKTRIVEMAIAAVHDEMAVAVEERAERLARWLETRGDAEGAARVRAEFGALDGDDGAARGRGTEGGA